MLTLVFVLILNRCVLMVSSESGDPLKKRVQYSSIGCLFLVLLLIGVTSVQAEEDAFEITFDEEVLTSNSSRSKLNEVIFYGNITKANWSSATSASLWASSPENWSAIPIPSWMSFRDEMTQSFMIQVIVPQRLLVDIYDINLTLSIRDNETRWIENGVCHVWVHQYYGIDLGTGNNVFYIEKQDTIEGIINITNIGNGLDVIEISVLDTEGIVVKDDLPEEISIPEFSTVAVPYRIKIDFQDRAIGWYYISINITSKGSRDNGSAFVYTDEVGVPLHIRNMPSVSTFYLSLILGTSCIFVLAVLIFLINKNKQKK